MKDERWKMEDVRKKTEGNCIDPFIIMYVGKNQYYKINMNRFFC